MELNVGDRLILLSILPKQADITALRVVRELKEALSFDEEEHRQLEFVNEGDTIKWNDTQIDKDISISDVARGIIKKAFKGINAKGELREEHIPLYEKFVEDAD